MLWSIRLWGASDQIRASRWVVLKKKKERAGTLKWPSVFDRCEDCRSCKGMLPPQWRSRWLCDVGTARLRLATNVRTVKASHLAKFSSKVPPWLGSADVEKRCLLPYTSTATTRLLIHDRAVHSQRECWEMLQQRTWVHFAQRGRSVFLFLVLRNTPAASSPPASDPDNKRNLQLQPNARHVFSACIRPFLPKTLPLPASIWSLEDLLCRLFHKTLPIPVRVWPLNGLLRRNTSRVLWLERLQHCPFKRFWHSLTFGRLLSKPSCFLWRFIFVRSLQSFSDIVFWERIVFCFVVVSASVCNHLILEWIIAHYFLFLCSISFCMYLFDKFSSSSVDKFDSTRLKSISSALALSVSRGRHAKLIGNFSHESDVTFLKTPF